MLRKAHARNTAKGLLKQLGIQKAPVNLDRIINKLSTTNLKQLQGLNIEVVRQDFQGDLKDVSAILIKEKRKAVIAVNADHTDTRQRFSIAHELGHLILHSNTENLKIEKQFFTRSDSVRSLDELEANEFAAELLMPEELIINDFFKKVIEDEDSVISVLAKKYKVSEAALTYRLINLNLLEP
ncbi:MAG: ImmA/IrrE family metallo-endopeptidase [Deltaproteobacteria bacterium]|nr:ImmA/IrrE family metallo-endopeptidase [Deltaproteobacteria bacterium]